MATLDREHEAGGLEVQLEQEGERIVVRARGELDLTSVKGFETKLREAIQASPSGVIVDLSGVTFIDSIALRVLIAAATLSHAGWREFSVVRASVQVRQVIEASGVEDLLPLVD
jgi:anti-sigma B factor antagonist